MANIHIAFVRKPTARLLLSGAQTCESRLSIRLHPAAGTGPGDGLIFKCGDGVGLARVSRVENYTDLLPSDVQALSELYTREVDGPRPDPEYWASKGRARYATFLHLECVESVHIPSRLLPTTMFAWIQDFAPSAEVKAAIQASRQGRLSMDTPTFGD